MAKLIVSLISIALIYGASIVGMIYGWGIEPQNWGWIIASYLVVLSGSVIANLID